MRRRLQYSAAFFIIVATVGFAAAPPLFDNTVRSKEDLVSEMDARSQRLVSTIQQSNSLWNQGSFARGQAFILAELQANNSLVRGQVEVAMDFLVIATKGAIYATENDDNGQEIEDKVEMVSALQSLEELEPIYLQHLTTAQQLFKELRNETAQRRQQAADARANKRWYWVACISIQTIGLLLGLFAIRYSDTGAATKRPSSYSTSRRKRQ